MTNLIGIGFVQGMLKDVYYDWTFNDFLYFQWWINVTNVFMLS